MPVHDWTRVSDGDFHDFQVSWITHLKESLNEGVLPEGYYAQSEQHAGRTIADILTLKDRPTSVDDRATPGVALADAPPQVSIKMVVSEATAYPTARRTITIRHRSGRQVVAMIELLSPGNKDGQHHLVQFVSKAVSAIWQGIHLLVIDIYPPGQYDCAGIHGAIWDEVGGDEFVLPEDRPLTLVSYLAEPMPEAFVEPVSVGMPLPDMPIFLTPDRYVSAPLEPTYMKAFRGVPEIVRQMVESKDD